MSSPTFDLTPQRRSGSEWADLATFIQGTSANYQAAKAIARRAMPRRRDREVSEALSAIAAFIIEIRRWPAR